MSDTLSELFARNPTEQPHTDAELTLIIEYFRRKRAEFVSDPRPATAAARAKKETKISLEDLLS